MAGKRAKVPDAWDDDDWEVKVDRLALSSQEPDRDSQRETEMQTPMTKAERLAQHAESNKKLWQSAEAPPEPFHFLASRAEPPLTSEFKPAVRVLSRKPAPRMITRRDPVTGALSQIKVEDDEADDDKIRVQLTPDEIRAKQQRELEEKQRRYEEVRAKIFGESSTSETRSSRGRGKGRGGGGGGGGGGGSYRYNDSRGDNGSSQRPTSSQSGPSNGRELYDPNYSPKPGFTADGRGSGGTPVSGRSTPRNEDQIIRSPRGPDGNSRGFARRGAKAG
ncbi:hypothetical protein GGR50DRAFT_238944 [Xylaria sp. CBS 124048]|nr:hypothetical protein GGR50DRAFT_238944 [Xylaria sp. CBS 124048]